MDATRRLTTTTETLGNVWSDGTLPFALVHAAVLLIAGWAVYLSRKWTLDQISKCFQARNP